jgi:hypothetical protein
MYIYIYICVCVCVFVSHQIALDYTLESLRRYASIMRDGMTVEYNVDVYSSDTVDADVVCFFS